MQWGMSIQKKNQIVYRSDLIFLWIYIYIQGAFHSNFPRFLGFGFRRKPACTKTKKGIDKASKHNRATLFFRLWSFACINIGGVNLFLSFILSLFYFLTICVNFHFLPHLCLHLSLRLCQSMLPPFSIRCTLFRVEHCRQRRRRCRYRTQYASFVGRSLVGYGRRNQCLGPTIAVQSS